jgi:hypothetical protein
MVPIRLGPVVGLWWAEPGREVDGRSRGARNRDAEEEGVKGAEVLKIEVRVKGPDIRVMR